MSHRVLPSWVDAPGTLTIDEPALLAARVQARELGRERVERRCYVDKVPAPDRDKHAIGLELERGRGRALPNPNPDPKGGGEGRGDAGRGRRGDDEPGQRQGLAGRGQQEHAPGVLLLAAHRQKGVPLDHDASGVQRRSERVYGTSGDLIRCKGYRCEESTAILCVVPVLATPIHRSRPAPVGPFP